MEAENLKVSDLCRTKEFYNAAQHRALRDGSSGENRVVPQAVPSAGPIKVSAGNLCSSDLAGLKWEFGVRLECNRGLRVSGQCDD